LPSAFILPLLLLLLTSRPALAFELGVGLEVGGTASIAQNPAPQPGGQTPAVAGAAALGILLEERFDANFLAFELFEDVQTPFALQTGGLSPAEYVPWTAGVRTGLLFGPWIPYLAVLFSVGTLSDQPTSSQLLSSTIFGIGGALGVDWKIADFRLGFELRADEIIGGIPAAADTTAAPNSPSSAFLLQALLSLRYSL
jgi:hypothetical protein